MQNILSSSQLNKKIFGVASWLPTLEKQYLLCLVWTRTNYLSYLLDCIYAYTGLTCWEKNQFSQWRYSRTPYCCIFQKHTNTKDWRQAMKYWNCHDCKKQSFILITVTELLNVYEHISRLQHSIQDLGWVCDLQLSIGVTWKAQVHWLCTWEM